MGNTTLFDDHNDLLLLFYNISISICVFLNGLAMYLIIFKSSPEMKTYRWHLLHYQVIASALDIFTNYLFQPIFFYPLSALTGHGFLITNLGIPTFACNWIYYNLLGALLFSIVELFFYRHQCIVRNKLTKKQFYFCLAFVFIYIVSIVNAFFLIQPIHTLKWSKMPEEKNPWIAELLKSPNVYYTPSTSRATTAYFILLTAAILLASLIPCFVCHIFYVLWKESTNLSTRTRKMQRKFFIFLIWQVTVPFVFLFIPLVFIGIRTFYGRLGLQMLNNISIMMMFSYGIVATVCLIYFNDPYREFLYGRLKRKKTASMPSFIQTKNEKDW